MIGDRILLATALVFGLTASASSGENPADWDDEAFVARVKTFPSMKRITVERFLMHPETAQLCRAANQPARHSPHENRYCDVFVSKEGEKAMKDGRQTYPVGAMIVKAKYPDQKSSHTELFTVMTKQPAGYDPKNGDWEYAVIDGKCQTVLARGRLQSCIQCHEEYRPSDFVTRLYMARKKAEAK